MKIKKKKNEIEFELLSHINRYSIMRFVTQWIYQYWAMYVGHISSVSLYIFFPPLTHRALSLFHSFTLLIKWKRISIPINLIMSWGFYKLKFTNWICNISIFGITQPNCIFDGCGSYIYKSNKKKKFNKRTANKKSYLLTCSHKYILISHLTFYHEHIINMLKSPKETSKFWKPFLFI